MALPELARRLKRPASQLAGMLRVLESRGYIGQAYNESDACKTGCQSCSMVNLCPAQGTTDGELGVWRLTEKGRQVVENSAQSPTNTGL